jgi:NAD+ synthase
VAIIGISGGIDSAVTVALAVHALDSNRVFGLILPDSSVTPKSDTKNATDLAQKLNIKYKVIELSNIKKKMLIGLPSNKNKLAIGNLLVRLWMIFLYYYASILDVLVLGTGDKSEMSLGYFTKYGDSAVDLLPIADVYKTEVRSLARYLSIPQEIVDKRTVRVYGKGIQQKAKLELAMRILTRF